MKVGLNFGERLILMGILPKEGNFVTLKILRELTAKLGVSQEEYKEFEIVEDKKINQVYWGQKGSEEKEMEFGEKECDLIVESLEKLDKEKKLEQRHFTLYEKFVKIN